MTKWRQMGIGLLTLAMAAGCGKSESERRAEESAKQVEEAAKQLEAAAKESGQNAEAMAKGLEAMAKGLAGAAGTLGGGDGTPTEPVSFRDLIALFPEVEGWQMEKPRGERMTSPVAYAEASTSYRKDGSALEVKITDSAFHQLLMLPYAMVTSGGFERETTEGYEKAVKVAGHPGIEKWNEERKRGELTVVVAKRFLVNVEGRGLDSPRHLQALLSSLDLGRLEKLGS